MLDEALLFDDAERPRFHVMPPKGWMNDPNGPIYYEGRYHLFYQHLSSGCEWNWGIVWGHASSEDLVSWEHHPLALEPSGGSWDADGCFSGCCVLNDEGMPTILYTGVRLRSNPDCEPLPPEDQDLQLPFIESQLMAVADKGLKGLTKWTKMDKPFLALPPAGMDLTGWRDPFVFQRSDGLKDWLLLMGSGIKGQGGTVLVYKTSRLCSEWELDGCLCKGDAATGAMWECPLLIQLRSSSPSSTWTQKINHFVTPSKQEGLNTPVGPDKLNDEDDPQSTECEPYLFCVSPDAPTNPVICWIGSYENGRFDLENARGPFRIDLGDVLYAPNMTIDAQDRCLLWGWLQERRKVGAYSYAGCLSVPRVLSARGGKLFQEPCEEIYRMHTGTSVRRTDITISPECTFPLDGICSVALDLQITLERGMSNAMGILLRSWNASGEGSAVIVFDWDCRSLKVVFEAIDPTTMDFCINSSSNRSIGGIIDYLPGSPLHLRILIDHSVLEIFTGSGEVLSTRVYRGEPPVPEAGAGIDFVAFGGAVNMPELEASEMCRIFCSGASGVDEEFVSDIPSEQQLPWQKELINPN